MSHYILNGHEPVRIDDTLQWAYAFETQDRRVALTEIGPARISTVFLGLDHGWQGVPLLFETMVFWRGHDMDETCERYTTWEQAEIGHTVMVERVRDLLAGREST